MPVDVTMPKLSDTMEEGKILRWMKQPGDRIAIGEIIAEVETDKANMELEVYDAGLCAEVRVAEGQSAPVGAVIAVLAEPGEEKGKAAEKRPAPPARAAAKEAPAPEPDEKRSPKGEPREPWRPTVVKRAEQPEAADEGHVKASPLARRIASEHGLDLRAITGRDRKERRVGTEC